MEKNTLKWILISPILVVLLLSITIFGNPIHLLKEFFSFQNNLVLTTEDFPRLSEVITITISIYTVLASSIFSFLLYKITKKGTTITEQLGDIQINNEFNEITVAATIIDMDIVYSLSTLAKWYAENEHNKSVVNMPYIQFNENYREYVGKIIKVVGNKEERSLGYQLNHLYYMTNLYNMYSKDKENTQLKDTLNTLCKDIFNDETIKSSTEDDLKYTPLTVLQLRYNYIISTLNTISLAKNLEEVKICIKEYSEKLK